MEKDSIILIQGALEEELEYFLSVLSDREEKIIAGYEFYLGKFGTQKVILSKTLVGTLHSTMATTIGLLTFHPNIVINQGIAGAHSIDLHIGDIVIGESCVNINSYKMPLKGKGKGSNPFEWEMNKRAKEVKFADRLLVEKIEENLSLKKNKVYRGILGSGDVFNRKYDRITWIQNTFHNLSEDMESIGCYSVCNRFSVPCIGIRIISNNELLQEEIDKSVACDLQEALFLIIKTL